MDTEFLPVRRTQNNVCVWGIEVVWSHGEGSAQALGADKECVNRLDMRGFRRCEDELVTDAIGRKEKETKMERGE